MLRGAVTVTLGDFNAGENRGITGVVFRTPWGKFIVSDGDRTQAGMYTLRERELTAMFTHLVVAVVEREFFYFKHSQFDRR